MRTRAIDSLEGATVHHRAAMQSRTVAHSLHTDNRRRQAASLRHLERRRLGREIESEILLTPGLSLRRFRRVASRRNVREMARARRVFPDEMTLGDTYVDASDNICARSLVHVNDVRNTLPSRSNRNRLTCENDRRVNELFHPGIAVTSTAAASAARIHLVELEKSAVTSAVVNYTIPGTAMTLAKFSRFVSLVNGKSRTSFRDRPSRFLSRNFSRETACHVAPLKALTSICALVVTSSADKILVRCNNHLLDHA